MTARSRANKREPTGSRRAGTKVAVAPGLARLEAMQRLANQSDTVRQHAAWQNKANVVQRYTVKPADDPHWGTLGFPLRVSEDENMAVRDSPGAPSSGNRDFQHFFATPAVLNHSRQVLQNIESEFTIAQGADTLVVPRPRTMMQKLRRAPAETKTLYRAIIRNPHLQRSEKGDYSLAACTANLANFLGQLKGDPDDPERFERGNEIVAVFSRAFGQAEENVVDVSEDLTKAMLLARNWITSSTDETEKERVKQSYDNLNGVLRRWYAAHIGINESAVPDVGEAWGVFTAGKTGQAGYGHFAPVIAASGQDRVTFENDVSNEGREHLGEGPNIINPNWYVRMLGPRKSGWFSTEDQTFYGEAKRFETEEFGDEPLVVRLASRAPQQD